MKKIQKKLREVNMVSSLNHSLKDNISKVGDHSQGWPEGSLFNSCYTEVEGKCATPFSRLFHFTLDPYLIRLSVRQGGIVSFFESLVWLDLELNPSFLSHWQTLTARPIYTKLHPMVRLQSWSHQLNCHYSQVYSVLEY